MQRRRQQQQQRGLGSSEAENDAKCCSLEVCCELNATKFISKKRTKEAKKKEKRANSKFDRVSKTMGNVTEQTPRMKRDSKQKTHIKSVPVQFYAAMKSSLCWLLGDNNSSSAAILCSESHVVVCTHGLMGPSATATPPKNRTTHTDTKGDRREPKLNE